VLSAHAVLGVPNVSAFFGTAPDFWNLLLLAMVKFVPASLLGDRDFATKYDALSISLISHVSYTNESCLIYE